MTTRLDNVRRIILASAELFDAWRIVPRILVMCYGVLCWLIVEWYMNLTPKILEGCDIEILGELCIVQAPTTQHAALVTIVIGASAGIFGLYTNGGRRWSGDKFNRWDQNGNRSARKESIHQPDYEHSPYKFPDKEYVELTNSDKSRRSRSTKNNTKQYSGYDIEDEYDYSENLVSTDNQNTEYDYELGNESEWFVRESKPRRFDEMQ